MAPPPQMAPQAPMRQPQTASDPGNAGAAAAAGTGALPQLVAILGELNKGVNEIGKTGRSSVLLQRVILKVLLTLAEQQGLSPDDMAKLVALQDDDSVEKFVAALGNVQGKS